MSAIDCLTASSRRKEQFSSKRKKNQFIESVWDFAIQLTQHNARSERPSWLPSLSSPSSPSSSPAKLLASCLWTTFPSSSFTSAQPNRIFEWTWKACASPSPSRAILWSWCTCTAIWRAWRRVNSLWPYHWNRPKPTLIYVCCRQ